MKLKRIGKWALNAVGGVASSLGFLRRSVVYFVPFLLSLQGCDEVVPQSVEEHIVIERDGSIAITYSGTFHDLADWLAVYEPEKADAAKVSRAALHALSVSPDVAEVREVKPHVYFVRRHLKTHLNEHELPWLIRDQGSSTNWSVAPLRFTEMSGISNGFQVDQDSLKSTLKALQEKLHDETQGGKELAKLVRAFKATVTIEIDDDMVGYTDATSKRRIGPGRSSYQWTLQVDKYRPPHFAFAFGDVDQAALKLDSAPAGTDCKSLIGDLCKCGPFILKGADDSMHTSYVPYEVSAGERTFHGCTNAKGEIPAVMTKRTGGCYVKLLPQEPALENEAARGKGGIQRGATCPAH
ncbi:hypothetical protein WKW77_06435 [Variovorax ureilyticus]|uniref:Lipoprotein n=1 Tax=Variovorax ureilyticus TaxID=1836198 RepID=A0ABU8VAL2_9BURK